MVNTEPHDFRPTTPELAETGRLAGAKGAREPRRLPDNAPDTDALLVRVLQCTRDGVLVLTPDARLVQMNYGGREAIRLPSFERLRNTNWLDFWSGEDRVAAERAVQIARAGGVGRFTGYFPTFTGEPRWWDVLVSSIRDPGGRPEWLVVVSRDVTEQRQAEERQRLLREELNHRVKNTLASVMSLAIQTARAASTPDDFNRRFQGRLQALARAHDLLTRKSWEKVQLSEVVDCVLYGDGAARVALEGAPALISARAAVSLALALHELATNALQHGALSAPGGRLEITTSQDPGTGALTLNWVETAPAPIPPPRGGGLGLRLVRMMVEGDLGGRVRIDFKPTGLTANLEFKASGATA